MKYYYGYIQDGFGFVDEDDPRHTQKNLIELTEEYHQQLLDEQAQGKEIVCFDGNVFTAEPGLYYIDKNNQWQKKNNDDFEAEKLALAKQLKYSEAFSKAYSYLNDGEGLFEFESGKHIEATGDNFAKLTPYLLDLAYKEITSGGSDKIFENLLNLLDKKISGKTIQWTTKEDEVVNLNLLQIINILYGIGSIQSNVWGRMFVDYKSRIEQAQTVQDVNAITINYGG